MSLLKERIELLESDLAANPPRIAVYHDLPFAILRYDPPDEWKLRRELKLLATRLEGTGKHVQNIRLSDLLWEGIEKSEGLDEIVELEKDRGFTEAQAQVTTYLENRRWQPLADLLSERLKPFDPAKDVAFITRVAAMAPKIYEMSKLLDQMKGKTRVTTILFYPGSIEGTTGLRFMDLKNRDPLGNYRVKIYG